MTTHMRTRLLLIMSLESSGTSSQSMPCSAMARQGDSCWVWRWRQYVLDKQRQHGSIHLLNPSCHYFKLNLSCHYLKLNLSCHYFKIFGVWILQAKYKDAVSHNGLICQACRPLLPSTSSLQTGHFPATSDDLSGLRQFSIMFCQSSLTWWFP